MRLTDDAKPCSEALKVPPAERNKCLLAIAGGFEDYYRLASSVMLRLNFK